MPIIESVAAAESTSQGDLFCDVPLFVTDKLEDGARTSHKMCLVLSRPCFAFWKPKLVVAGVEKYPDSVPRDLNTFDDVLQFLTK